MLRQLRIYAGIFGLKQERQQKTKQKEHPDGGHRW